MSHSLTPLHRLAKRLSPHTRGWMAEKYAMLFYMAHGWCPLNTAGRELAQTDLILIKKKELILVEVKFRSSRSRGHLAVGQGQQQRLQRQMQALAGRYPAYTLRLEIFLVFPHWPFCQRIQQPYVR